MYHLNFCEYNRSNQDYDTIFRPAGSGDYLFLLFKAPMKIYQGEQIVITQENACILYTPGTSQHYQAVRRFCNSYFHFHADENPTQLFGLPENRIFYPGNPVVIDSYISRLQKEHFSSSLFREEAIQSLTTMLFLEIARDIHQPAAEEEKGESFYPAFQKLRLKMLVDCHEDWNIERLCRNVNLEKSQFYTYYRDFFSSTPKNDLLHARLEKAKNLLSNEVLQVKEVALLCGFHNQTHFIRYFKMYCGCAPGEYAREMIKSVTKENG